MEINSQYGKTKIVVFRNGEILPRNLKFYFNGTELETVPSFSYLGIILALVVYLQMHRLH